VIINQLSAFVETHNGIQQWIQETYNDINYNAAGSDLRLFWKMIK
jgi:hypothetical protein